MNKQQIVQEYQKRGISFTRARRSSRQGGTFVYRQIGSEEVPDYFRDDDPREEVTTTLDNIKLEQDELNGRG